MTPELKELEQLLKPYKTSDKVRIGSVYDGGYILPNDVLKKVKLLLSFGVSTNFDFEKAMTYYVKELDIFMFDPFIGPIADFSRLVKRIFKKSKVEKSNKHYNAKENKNYKGDSSLMIQIPIRLIHWIKFYLFINKQNITFKKMGVRNYSDKTFMTFCDIKNIIVKKELSNYIIKLDIEGDEYLLINDILANSNSLEALLIEVHHVESKHQELIDLIQKLKNSDLYLCHIHGNNSDSLVPGTTIPNTLELTFAKSAYLTKPLKLDTSEYPVINIDSPCEPRFYDYELEFLK